MTERHGREDAACSFAVCCSLAPSRQQFRALIKLCSILKVLPWIPVNIGEVRCGM